MSCSYHWKCDKCPVYDDRYACPHFMGIKTYIPPVFRRKPKIKEEKKEEEEEKKEAGRPGYTSDDVLEFIRQGTNELPMLANRMTCSVSAITYHLRKLRAAGKIKPAEKKRYRGTVWEIVDDNTNTKKN